MNWTLSIDFGTSNTAAAMRQHDGRVTTIKLDTAGDTMPSSVIVTDLGFRVGQAALNARRSYPNGFVGSPKERLGHGAVLLGTGEIAPSDLVAQVLTAVRERAIRTAGGTPPSRLILTHPVRWGNQRLAELLEGARKAGFAPGQIFPLPEPIAALHAHVSPKTLPQGSRVAVVDVGGGTSDIAVLQSTGDPVPGRDLVVVAQDGDDRLGGNDLDAILMGWVRTQLEALGRQEVLTALDDPRNLGALLTLRDVVRGAKQDLSEHPDAPIGVSVGGVEIRLTVTRDEYEQLIAPGMARVAELVTRSLVACDTRQLAGLYLTGGTAYTPSLARALHQATGILASPMGDPKLATALGALRTPVALGIAAPQSQAVQQAPTGPPGLPYPGRPMPATGPGPQPQSRPMVMPVQGQPRLVQPQPQVRPMVTPQGNAGRPTSGRDHSSRNLGLILGGSLAVLLVVVVVVVAMMNRNSKPAPTAAAGSVTSISTPVVVDPNVECWDGSMGAPCPALEGYATVDFLLGESDSSTGRTCDLGETDDPLPSGELELYGCSWADLDETTLYLARYESVSEAARIWEDYGAGADSFEVDSWWIVGQEASGQFYDGVDGEVHFLTYCYDQVPFCVASVGSSDMGVSKAKNRWAPTSRDDIDEALSHL